MGSTRLPGKGQKLCLLLACLLCLLKGIMMLNSGSNAPSKLDFVCTLRVMCLPSTSS